MFFRLTLMVALFMAVGVQAGPETFAVQKLRTYCAACHALGGLRFIYSDDDSEVWSYLFTGQAPISKKLWSEAIQEVLSWPSDDPPPFNEPISPTKDWMPKGEKRLRMAEDHENGTSIRLEILRALRENGPLDF